MTAIARSYGQTRATHEIDVRCSAALPRADAEEVRCQLFAGHDGPHAVMFAHGGKRKVRVWKRSSAGAAADASPDALQRPWMFGYPVPAWFETDSSAESTG